MRQLANEELTPEQLDKLNLTAQELNYDDEDTTTPSTKKPRDWFITINEGAECRQNGTISYETMADFLNCKFSTLSYACWDEEIGDNGNNHLHLFLCLPNGRTFNSMRKHFAGANVQKKKGSAFFALNYIRKPKGLILKGKEKDHTQIKPFVETGDFDLITEKGLYDKDGSLLKEKKKSVNDKITEYVAQYNTIEEIALVDPYIYNTYRPTLMTLFREKTFSNFVKDNNVQEFTDRDGDIFYKVNKKVYYVYGQEGSGKSFSTRLEYGDKGKVGIVTFNKGVPNFDNYNSEPVMYLNEFKGNIPLSVLQNLLEEHINYLDARYSDRCNLAHTYIFDSNIPFNHLYQNVQQDEPDKYRSFVRRITGGVWETYQTNTGERYIALHEEFLPKSARYGDKYKPDNLKPPFSEEYTGFKCVSLFELNYIKDYEMQYVYEVKNNELDLKENYIDYKDILKNPDVYFKKRTSAFSNTCIIARKELPEEDISDNRLIVDSNMLADVTALKEENFDTIVAYIKSFHFRAYTYKRNDDFRNIVADIIYLIEHIRDYSAKEKRYDLKTTKEIVSIEKMLPHFKFLLKPVPDDIDTPF